MCEDERREIEDEIAEIEKQIAFFKKEDVDFLDKQATSDGSDISIKSDRILKLEKSLQIKHKALEALSGAILSS